MELTCTFETSCCIDFRLSVVSMQSKIMQPTALNNFTFYALASKIGLTNKVVWSSLVCTKLRERCCMVGLINR